MVGFLIMYGAVMALATAFLCVAGTDWLDFDMMVLMAASMQ